MDSREKKAQHTQQRLLQAASRIILKSGVNALTLEAAAQEAEVSKGGLLYHFPTKEALLQALVRSLVALFYERLEAELAQANEPVGTPGRWLRAYIRATFHAPQNEDQMSAALAVVVASEPQMLDFLHESFQQMGAQIEQDGLDPVVASVIRFATDGLWYSEVLGLTTISAERRQQIFEYVMRLTQQEMPHVR